MSGTPFRHQSTDDNQLRLFLAHDSHLTCPRAFTARQSRYKCSGHTGFVLTIVNKINQPENVHFERRFHSLSVSGQLGEFVCQLCSLLAIYMQELMYLYLFLKEVQWVIKKFVSWCSLNRLLRFFGRTLENLILSECKTAPASIHNRTTNSYVFKFLYAAKRYTELIIYVLKLFKHIFMCIIAIHPLSVS